MSYSLIEYVGYATALYAAYKLLAVLLRGVFSTFLASPLDVKKLGEWAIVTGATDGIGKAYAFALAKRGLNVVLISRTLSKLKNVSEEIESKFDVKTKVIDVDFSTSDAVYAPRIEREIEGLEVGVLVNNVGKSYDHPEEFAAIENGAEETRSLVLTNVCSVNAMTRLVLPQMVERRKGAVVNISSMSCMFPSPLLTVYAASKAYVDTFTKNLDIEYRRKGITVQCVLPGYVVSNMSKIRKPSLLAPSPQAFVKSALGRLGVCSRTTGYWSHDLMEGAINSLPEGIKQKLLYDQIGAIRKRALKKKAKEQ